MNVPDTVEYWLERGIVIEYAYVFVPGADQFSPAQMHVKVELSQCVEEGEPQLSLYREIYEDAGDEETLAVVIDSLARILMHRLLTPLELETCIHIDLEDSDSFDPDDFDK